jgi:raffinose/stachyose/melibiose transport system permease protein
MEWSVMNAILRNKKTIILFLLPALSLYVVLVMYSIINAFYYSLFSWNALSPKVFIGLKNYIRMLNDETFLLSLGNVLFILLFSVIFQQLAGFLWAVLLTGKTVGKNLYRNIFFAPAVISSVAVGLMWTFIFHPNLGLVNSLLDFIGLDSWTRPWLQDKITALWAISFVTSWQYAGYSMILFIAAIQNIPSSIFESARIDGANAFGIIRHITLPLIKPMIKVNTIIICIGSLKFFDLVYSMTGGGPVHRTEVLASYIYTRSFQFFEYGYGNALSIILLTVCLFFTVVINKIFKTENLEY